MLPHVFVPNSLICDADDYTTIVDDKIINLLNENFNYAAMLVDEATNYRAAQYPYELLDTVPSGSYTDYPLALHQYFHTTELNTTYFPNETIPADSDVIRVQHNYIGVKSRSEYIILPKSRTYFQYMPTDTGDEYWVGRGDPAKNKTILRPYGEFINATKRFQINGGNSVLLSNDDLTHLAYNFKGKIGNQFYFMTARPWFPTDRVLARIYLSSDAVDPIMTVPVSFKRYDDSIYLQLPTSINYPSQYYVEVF